VTATRFIGVDLAWREGSADVAANETGVAVIDENGQNLDAGCFVSETYLYATLADVAELGYDTERPRYKRKPPNLRAAQWRAERAANCDTLIGRLGQLADADPPLLLQSHPVTRDLAGQLSPVSDPAYKQREDLIDALLCAWTASLWARHGFDRCQVLGLPATPNGDPAATMIVPARPEQRRKPLPQSALPAAR
jgi:predicted RNase H-like nuclease